MRTYLTLFLTFMRIGGLTFGGGYAMLPMMQRELVENHGWTTESELADYYAISQCTPGVIAINTATFIGYKVAGILGGIFATLGVAFPSLVIITIIAAFLQNFADLAVVQHAFAGIRVCVCVLIFQAVRKLWKNTVVSISTSIIFGVVFILSAAFSISPIILVALAGISGAIIKTLENKNKEVK